jgi:hypothetical protein
MCEVEALVLHPSFAGTAMQHSKQSSNLLAKMMTMKSNCQLLPRGGQHQRIVANQLRRPRTTVRVRAWANEGLTHNMMYIYMANVSLNGSACAHSSRSAQG